uniref:Uncharacterized protein n=1 Tax=Timema shepardi TaxID=629360 RepID=A0A7R9G2P9_TIMSH|nr:unnamed protein product [Timema shepardi]
MLALDIRLWVGQAYCASPLVHSVVVCEDQDENYCYKSDGKHSQWRAGSEGNTGPSSPGSRLAVTSSCHYMAHERLSYAFSVWRMEGDWNGGGHV